MTENQNIVFEKLCKIVKDRGNDICKDPKMIEGLLKDNCSSECKKEINHLVITSKESIPLSFISYDGSTPKEITIAQKIKQLVRDYDFKEETAAWAVEAWAKALGFIDDFSKQQFLKPRPAPKPSIIPNIVEKIPSLEVNDGEITTLSGKHFEIFGNIIVNKGGTLKIEGADLKFDEFCGINCLGGSLNISGSRFNAINSKKGWKNITFENSEDNNCSVESCTFENSRGGATEGSLKINGGVITCINSDLVISNSKFIYCFMPSNTEGGALHIHKSDVKVDSCHFINCSADRGGAIYFNKSESCVINNCFFENCASESSGGAIFSSGSIIEISGDSRFEQCSSLSGGGIYIESSSFVFVEKCEFNKCHGSALVSNDSHLSANGCTFSYCAEDNGHGGAMLIKNSTVTLQSSNFINCEAGNIKKDYYLFHGGALGVFASNISIESCGFNGCTSGIGGAIHADSSHLNISDSSFQNNKSTDKGIIYIDSHSIAFINKCSFNNNDGTSICYYSGSEGCISKCEFENCKANGGAEENNGGAVNCSSSEPKIIECKFIKCHSTSGKHGNGGAIYYSTSNSIIEKCEFIICESSLGGAISLNNSSDLNIYDCKFERCSNSALYISNNSDARINKAVFLSCGSKFNEGYGGAISMVGSHLKMIDSSFENCSAYNDFNSQTIETKQNEGGAIFCSFSSINLVNVHMDNCYAVNGGGIFSDDSIITIFSSEFRECEAKVSGGGIFLNSTSSSTVSGSVFKSCKNSGIFSDNSNSKFLSCLFEECKAESGGGMSINGEKECMFKCNFNKCSSSGLGGGIFCDGVEIKPSISTCTFIDCDPNDVDRIV